MLWMNVAWKASGQHFALSGPISLSWELLLQLPLLLLLLTEKGTSAAQSKVEKTLAAGNATEANWTGRVWRGTSWRATCSPNGTSHTQTANSQQTKTWQKSKPWQQPKPWQQIESWQTVRSRQSATKIMPLATQYGTNTRHCEKSRHRPLPKRKHSSLGTQLWDQWGSSGRGAFRTEMFCVG